MFAVLDITNTMKWSKCTYIMLDLCFDSQDKYKLVKLIDIQISYKKLRKGTSRRMGQSYDEFPKLSKSGKRPEWNQQEGYLGMACSPGSPETASTRCPHPMVLKGTK